MARSEETMAEARWLIYGANGYSGQLVVEEAVRRGHRPVLAGRSTAAVAEIAERLGLDFKAFSLDDPAALERELQGFDLVFNAAGPFAFTAAAMVRACLATRVNYVDITGEISVFQAIFAQDAAARASGIGLLPGAGFDVIPTDCLAKHVAEKVPGAERLEIAFAGIDSPSAGTVKSALEHLPKGSFVRRGGRLVSIPPGSDSRHVRFSDKERSVVAIPWGDLETAYHSTGIANITTYMAQSPRTVSIMRRAGPALATALRFGPLRKAAQWLAQQAVTGPTEATRRAGRSLVWACATARDGRSASAWLDTLEGYAFTAKAGVRAVERFLAERPIGAFTPSLAFGADFVLEIEGTHRLDALP
jgi:short subunit dehydrogenase-like uncharacterized protein